MTKQEAIEELAGQYWICIDGNQEACELHNMAIDMAIEALQRGLENVNADSCSEKPNRSDLISRQWLMECVNERWIKFDTEKDENRFIHLVRDIAPSAQPTSGDCISRQGIEWHDYLVSDGNGQYHEEKIAYKNQIDELPSAQPKTGEWIPFDLPWYQCSECGALRENKSFMENFCPNCGSYNGGKNEV